jgi:hypothetical protein
MYILLIDVLSFLNLLLTLHRKLRLLLIILKNLQTNPMYNKFSEYFFNINFV